MSHSCDVTRIFEWLHNFQRILIARKISANLYQNILHWQITWIPGNDGLTYFDEY